MRFQSIYLRVWSNVRLAAEPVVNIMQILTYVASVERTVEAVLLRGLRSIFTTYELVSGRIDFTDWHVKTLTQAPSRRMQSATLFSSADTSAMWNALCGWERHHLNIITRATIHSDKALTTVATMTRSLQTNYWASHCIDIRKSLRRRRVICTALEDHFACGSMGNLVSLLADALPTELFVTLTIQHFERPLLNSAIC